MGFVSYVTFMKHAQKITNSRTAKTRPILGGVLHKNGFVAATDSHRLYIAHDIYEGDEKVIDPKTGAIISGQFPEVTRLVSDVSDAKCSVTIDVNIASRGAKMIEQAGKLNKKSDFISISNPNKELLFSVDKESDIDCSFFADSEPHGEKIDILASAKYVSEAFAVFKDAGFDKCTFNYYGDIRPFTLTAGNFTALILPVRREYLK